MSTEKALFNFIREAVKSGGSVDVSFYGSGDNITASIESAYLKIPKEEEEVDIIKITPAPGEDAEPVTIIRAKKEEGASA